MADSILELLNGLGQSSDEVAAYLLGQGYKGTHGAGFCPVAVCLVQSGLCKAATVSGPVVNYVDSQGRPHRIATPQAVGTFVMRFDNGQFPALCIEGCGINHKEPQYLITVQGESYPVHMFLLPKKIDVLDTTPTT